MTITQFRHMMKVVFVTFIAIVVLRLLSGCYLDSEVRYVPEERVAYCVNAYRQVTECDYYYEWVPGYYTTNYVWVYGRYRLRQGWAYPPRHTAPWYRPPHFEHRGAPPLHRR